MTPEDIRKRVADARKISKPVLLGFDANGIQELVTASSRPIAMRGASEMVRRFDQWVNQQPGIIFAGGGRGLRMVSEDQVEATRTELLKKFGELTLGGVLAIAPAAWDSGQERDCLKLLQLRLGNAKDEAPRPQVPLVSRRQDQCADCRLRRAEVLSLKPDPQGERICRRCEAAIQLGRQTARKRAEAGMTLEDIAEDGQVAVVSADGNNMGELFSTLETLEQHAACSAWVDEVFQGAHRDAIAVTGDSISPVTGGDDIRAFLSPSFLLEYVTHLAKNVGARADREQDGLRQFVAANRSAAKLLSRIGIGIGAVVAPFHHPASRLVEYAHHFESRAKKICRGQDKQAVRSAFDFEILTSGQELSEGTAERGSEPFKIPTNDWEHLRKKARLLSQMPQHQLSQLFRGHDRDEAEQRNLFRYQVARIKEWQAWFEGLGIDWRDQNEVDKHMPDPQLIKLAQLPYRATRST